MLIMVLPIPVLLIMVLQPMQPTSTLPAGGAFLTTRWSLVLAAQGGDAPGAEAALATLCQTYWYPLYAFVRRHGHSPHDAQDLTQEFFARLLTRNYLAQVAREKGKFRSFLLAAMKHFLANEWDRARTLKRGGGQTIISLDADAETRYQLEPVETTTAETLYERRWALTLLERVMDQLRADYARQGKADHYDALKACLTGTRESAPYAELATRLGLTEGAVKTMVHRLRKRYRELLRAEIAQTVTTPAEVEDEIRHLRAVLV